jgi:hypothetical protein
MPIKKQRPRELLELPEKPENPLDGAKIERVSQRDSRKPNKLLRQLGELVTPESCDYKGSFIVHIYGPKIPTISGSLKPTFVCQNTSKGELPEILAQLAFTELAAHMMARYGHKPPSNRTQKVTQEELN